MKATSIGMTWPMIPTLPGQRQTLIIIKKYTVIGVFSKIKYHVIIPVETTGSRFSYSLVSGGDVMTVYEALSLMIAFASLVVLILSYRK